MRGNAAPLVRIPGVSGATPEEVAEAEEEESSEEESSSEEEEEEA